MTTLDRASAEINEEITEETIKGPSVTGFIIVVAAAFVLLWLMNTLPATSVLFDYQTWIKNIPANPYYRFLWFLGDMTEAQFHKNIPGALGLISFAALAYFLDRARSKYSGFAITYGTGLWPAVFLASSLGLLLSNLLYGSQLWLNPPQDWVPTFTPFVSIPAGIVLIYGGNWRSVLTGSILGGLTGFPLAWLITQNVLQPLGFPAVIGSVTTMAIGGVISFEVCKSLPWMKKLPPLKIKSGSKEVSSFEMQKPSWLIRRVLADFTEANFYGNEIAGLGLILGTIICWFIAPDLPAYGSRLLPAVLASQLLASACGIFIYFKKWQKYGWYPTFVPVVSVGPAAVLTFGGSMPSIILGAVLGAIIGPPLAQAIYKRFPAHYHPYAGSVTSMAITTTLVIAILKYLLP